MLRSRLFVAVLAALIGLGGCERNGSTASRDGASKEVLATSASTPAAPPPAAVTPKPAVATVNTAIASTNFTLVAGACAQMPCAAEIELVANGQRLDAVPLEFAASDTKLVAKADDLSFTTRAPVTSFTAGEEEGAVTTAVLPVRLSAQRTGLLVQQSGGFEHVKRRRDLFIADDNKLKRVWSKQDGSGPVRSYADIVAATQGDEIVLVEGITIEPNQADQVTAQRLTWDETAKTLQATPVTAMTATVVGNFATAAAARSQYADACFGHFWMLRADQIGEKSKRFVLASLTPEVSGTTPTTNASGASNANPAGSDCSSRHAQRTAQFRPITNQK